MHLEPVDPLDLYVAQPIPWSLYDGNGRRLLEQGAEIESEQQMRALLATGLFRESATPPKPAEPAVTAATAKPVAAPAAESHTEEKALDETRLATGDSLQLQAQYDDGHSRFVVTLIGYLKSKGIVVTAPMRDGKLLLMREGQSFVARMFSGKSAYAFPATIIKVTNVPYPHLHLSYPPRVQAVMVRRDARAKVRVIAAVHSRNIPSAAAILSDLSTGGCSLLVDNPLGLKSEEIVVKFKVPVGELEQLLTLKGVIRGVQVDTPSDKGRSKFAHGIQFVELAAADQVTLTAFVYQKLIEDELKF